MCCSVGEVGDAQTVISETGKVARTVATWSSCRSPIILESGGLESKEGFRGSTMAMSPLAETICLTISGDLVALGTYDGGLFGLSFSFVGAVDGATSRL